MKVNKHGYKFTNKNNTRGGIIATILAVIAVILLIIGVFISFKNKGNGGLSVGALGASSFFLALIGLIEGLLSFKEQDKFFLFSWIGSIACAVIWIGMCVIIGNGMVN